MAEVLAKQPRPAGPRLTIVTNAGGPGVLATDALIDGRRRARRALARDDRGAQRLPPPHWSHDNPIDILGDAGPDRYAKALEIAAEDPNTDGLLVILTPQDMTDPTADRRAAARPYAKIDGKPVLASWMGGADVAAGEAILNRAGIPTFPYPDTAARVFNYMWRYTYNLRGIYETPDPARGADDGPMRRPQADAIIDAVRQQGRTLLTEFESKQLLAAYGIPDCRDARGATHRGRRRRSGRRESATPSCSSSTPRRSPTRPTSAA